MLTNDCQTSLPFGDRNWKHFQLYLQGIKCLCIEKRAKNVFQFYLFLLYLLYMSGKFTFLSTVETNLRQIVQYYDALYAFFNDRNLNIAVVSSILGLVYFTCKFISVENALNNQLLSNLLSEKQFQFFIFTNAATISKVKSVFSFLYIIKIVFRVFYSKFIFHKIHFCKNI